MKAQMKKTKDIFICVPGDSADFELDTNAADGTEDAIEKKSPKIRCLRGDLPSSDDGSSSSRDPSRPRSSPNLPTKADVDMKATFPPPIAFTLNQDKRAVKAVSYDRLRKKKYFVDKSDLIKEIYMNQVDDTYYCFPRAGSKSTVVSELIHWLLYDDATRDERLKCFEGTKIMDLAKDDKGNVQNGAIGFNQNIVIHADFGCVDVENLTLKEIKTEVTNEFCGFLKRQYSMSSEAMTVIESLKANDAKFFDEIVSCIKATLPQTTPDSVKRPVMLIIDNFDAPALRILNKTKSTEFALEVMGFFNFMLRDASVVTKRFFHKIILFGTHQPIGMNTKSNLKKIPIVSYPYGKEIVCSKFFFSIEDVKTILKNCGEEESKVHDLSKICGQYNIKNKEYFHPGSIVNYIERSKEEDCLVENPVYWSSLDSLDVLADLSSMLPYEMVLWTYQEDQILNFEYQRVLIYENLMRGDANTAYTYLLEAGYLTRANNENPPTYRIVNEEARHLFATRYKEWCERIPVLPNYEPMRCFGTGDYKGFFEIANNILKTNYASEDFQYEGQYHVYLSSFFHNVPEWHFKSNYQAGYGRYDFVAWSKSPLVDTGYVFEIAILKPDNNPKKKIAAKILEKRKQVLDREYFLEVQKDKVKCIIVVGCRKMLSYAIFDVIKPK